MNPLYNKDKWAAQMSEGKKTLILGHFLSGNEFLEWKLVEQLNDQIIGEGILRQYIFKKEKSEGDEMIRFDIIESPNWRKSHETAALLLNDYMSTELVETSSKDVNIGDVGYMYPSEKPVSILFTRSNMAARVVNMGRNLVSVSEVSDLLDAQFNNKNTTPKDDLLAVAIRFGVDNIKGKIGEKIVLQIRVESPIDKESWLKLTCDSGEFSKDDNQIFYHPEEKGSQKVSLSINGRNGRNHLEELTFEIE